MPAKKLYYEDPYLREFTAKVISCEKAENGWLAALDQTAFYPEGGGQPADSGLLGGAQVLDVRELDGEIFHLCSAPLPVLSTVSGIIDWDVRFDHMQQHSGEHIVSGMICARFGCDNVGFHLGEETVTIDFNAVITWDELLALEREANRYLSENHAADIRFYEGEELDGLTYRSKKPLDGAVRIVSFPGADCCACCGTHVAWSAEVGVVKFLSCQHFREGVRIELLCGARAYRCLSAAWEQNLRGAQLLSAKPQESAAAVERLLSELSEAKQRAAALEARWDKTVADSYAGQGDVLLFADELSPSEVQRLCDCVANRCGGRCAVFAGRDGGWRYAVAKPGGDLRELTKAMNAALRGRGGGKPFFVQGGAACSRAEIEAFFSML